MKLCLTILILFSLGARAQCVRVSPDTATRTLPIDTVSIMATITQGAAVITGGKWTQIKGIWVLIPNLTASRNIVHFPKPGFYELVYTATDLKGNKYADTLQIITIDKIDSVVTYYHSGSRIVSKQ